MEEANAIRHGYETNDRFVLDLSTEQYGNNEITDSEKSQVRNNKTNRLTRAYITTRLGPKRCRGTPSVSNTGAVAL